MRTVELGILLRIGSTGVPVILGSTRQPALLRLAIQAAIADCRIHGKRSRHGDLMSAAGARQQARLLRDLLAELGGDDTPSDSRPM